MLDSVEERHVGIASGVNNGISRVAGLLAIAVLGAVISAKFAASVVRDVAALTAKAPDASTAAFHLGVLIAGLLMIAGGIFAGFGIENPRRAPKPSPVVARRRPGSAVRGRIRFGGQAPLAPADTQNGDLIRSPFVGARGTPRLTLN